MDVQHGIGQVGGVGHRGGYGAGGVGLVARQVTSAVVVGVSHIVVVLAAAVLFIRKDGTHLAAAVEAAVHRAVVEGDVHIL